MVASFTRDDEDATVEAHIGSLPLDLSKPPSKDVSSQEVVLWPTQENDKSTFQFERYFIRENKSKGRRSKKKERLYKSQMCRVQLAICRNRRWFKLGDADLVINGEERRSIIAVPLINHNTPSCKQSNGNVIPMARLKGETLKCGLGNDAALCVVVNVSECCIEEEIMRPNLSTVVSWEYDPTEAAIVEKTKNVPAEGQKGGYLLKKKDVHQGEELEDRDERKSEKPVTIQEPTEIIKSSSLPPMRSLSPLQISASSKLENIVDRIMSAAYEPASSQASTATPRTHLSTPSRSSFSPILASLRAISSPLRQRSEGTLSKASVLDRVVTITSDAAPASQLRTLSEHIASSSPRTYKGNDQSVYFIEHDIHPSEMMASSTSSSFDPSVSELNKAHSRSSITMSTEKSSHMSVQSEHSELNYSKYSADDDSASSSQLSGKASAKHSSKKDGRDLILAAAMAELLEKTPSELYAIIHDKDPKGGQKIKREHEKEKKKKYLMLDEDEDSVESEHSDDSDSTSSGYEKVRESRFIYEDDSTFSFVKNSGKNKISKGSFADKLSLGKKFLCNFPLCWDVKEDDDKTLPHVGNNAAYRKAYLIGQRKSSDASTFTGYSSEVEFL